MSNKIETVMKILPFVRSSAGYTAELHQTFKGKQTLILFKIFHKKEMKATNLFLQSFILASKQETGQ